MDYHIELSLGNRIGGGQFGDVFEAIDTVHGKVAVKVLKQKPNETSTDWATRSKELLQEAQHLKSASHHNIVQVISVVREKQNDCMQMVAEFCDGGSIESDYKKGPLKLSLVRHILTDVCRGLSHIHGCGMCHRDIKPGNILKHGNSYKIGDFGLVTDRLVYGYASGAGYIAHLAPEVFNYGLTNTRTDIWALGMTAYRLLHGDIFYQQNFSSLDIEDMITSGGFGQKLPWLHHIPSSWQRFIRKMMNDDPTQRFQSVHDVSQALAKLSTIPNWECTYNLNTTVWKRKVGAREENVTLTKHSSRKFEWSVNRTGRSKKAIIIAGTKGQVCTPIVCNRELCRFFENRK